MNAGKSSLSQIVRGLDGVTAGPYEGRYVPGGMPTNCVNYGVVSLSAGKETCRVWKLEDAAHFARCSPDAMREIAVAFEALEDESEELRIRLAGAFLNIGKAEARATDAEATVAALRERMKVLEEALEPFAKEADIYDPPNGDDAQAAWSGDFPIGALRRARKALSTVEKEHD